MASAYRLGVERGDRWLSCLPLYHVGGLAVLFRSCLYGTAVIMHDGFHIEAINESLDTQQVTLISLVPTMLYRLLQARTRWPDSLRLVLLGGAAATADLITHAHTANVPIATTYGLTEAASQVATMLPDDMRRKPGCVGKPLLFTAVRIVNENGESCLPGEYGEIVVSGPTIMQGYVNNKEATAKALCNGELYTGDIGYVDEAGDLWLVQRRSDVIVTGGENVYPAEVEAVLKAHPAVTAVCVAGVDHPEWGQQVAAMIVLNKPGAISEAELLTYCRDHLAGYKLPRLIQFAGALPQTASGKIHRQAVAKRLQAHAHL
jgi:O-succinylbenzoic acid--CoA ligase